MNNTSDIQLVLADVDGTIVTPDKLITPRTRAAVKRLNAAGIAFAITSGRPARGMRMLIDPLELRLPIAGFNGGIMVNTDMTPLETRAMPPEIVAPLIRGLITRGLDAWVYQGNDWFLRDASAPYAERETKTVQFAPTVTDTLEEHIENVVKIVGVSPNHALVKACEDEARERFGNIVSAARSRPHYLDITHPDANKGEVLRWHARKLGIPLEAIATVGDMANDVLMFSGSGVSIAMGQATEEVKRSARRVTKSNTEDGFAEAVDRYVLNDR